MNVEELRSVQRTERQKDSLQHLRDSFYQDVAEYIAERKAEREQAAKEADDPFSSPEVTRLTDEIETAEGVVESIYERRVGKIVKRATFAAAGMATEDEGLTDEERELFEDLVARIEDNREMVIGSLVGDADADSAATDDAGDDATPDADPDPASTDPSPEPSDEPSPPDPDDLLAEAMGGGTETSAEAGPTTTTPSSEDDTAPTGHGDADSSPASVDGGGSPTPDGGDTPDADRTTLRITRDVGEIFGVDEREYDLASEDVVTLPTPNAEPLLARDAAERLDAE
ncbi:hypothetical protein [Haloplanus halobius]|uniref:hypothetical protein n=1 Tax=Haloplanus halobius TaxID=2934938 RepID=UPI00200FC21C|nr:hypothetical protein [Haloplanus sp. XH21]